MLELKGININNLECYLLIIRKKSFLFLSKPNLENLRHFVNVTQNPQQQDLNPNAIIEEKMAGQSADCPDFSKLKIHLDLNYIKQIIKTLQKQADQTTIHIMITSYQQIMVIPYIYRKFKDQREIKIFCTHIAYEMGRIYLKRFFDRVFHYDLLYSEPKELSYEQESKLQDQFYVRYGVQIKTWIRLFSKQEMQQSLKLVNKMNYGEIHDADGVKFRSFPSGHSLGSALWMFENTLTKQSMMFIRQLSIQTWRSISQIHLFPTQNQTGFKEKEFQNVDLLILANNSLITPEQQKPDTQILNLMKSVLENIEKGINTEVILEDELLVLDLIDFISFEMKDKFRGIFIENPEFNQIVSYANSYVEFLSPQYKGKIYQDPPQYPFENYLILRQKGFLTAGSLYDICDRQKIPLRELMRKSSPYIHFKSDFDAYFSGLKDQEIKVYKEKNYLSPQSLASLLTNINPKKIISFSNILSQIDSKWTENTGVIPYGKAFVINSQPYHHYISKNISPNIINKYEFVDGFLMAYPVNREFLRLDSTWKEEFHRHLKDNFIPVLEVNQFGLKTKNTQIWIEDYEIFIKSSHISQANFILQVISSITKTLRLK